MLAVNRAAFEGEDVPTGARLLGASGIGLVFLAGDPAYYTRHGFGPAHLCGFIRPFPVSPEEAWMVRALASDALGRGRLHSSRAHNGDGQPS